MGMVQQHSKFRPCHVIPAPRQQNGLRNSAVPEQLFETARELLELSARISHLFDTVPLMGHGFYVVSVIILEKSQYVRPWIIEPRIAFGHEHTRRSRRCSHGFGDGHARCCSRILTRSGATFRECPRPLPQCFEAEIDDFIGFRAAQLRARRITFFSTIEVTSLFDLPSLDLPSYPIVRRHQTSRISIVMVRRPCGAEFFLVVQRFPRPLHGDSDCDARTRQECAIEFLGEAPCRL